MAGPLAVVAIEVSAAMQPSRGADRSQGPHGNAEMGGMNDFGHHANGHSRLNLVHLGTPRMRSWT